MWVRISICIACFFAIQACGKWKVDTYRPTRVTEIKFGSEAGRISIVKNPTGFIDITFIVRMSRGKILTADNILKRVQVLDRDGSPEIIIGARKNDARDSGERRFAPFTFSIIGELALDSEGNLYVQNRFTPTQSRKKSSIDDLNITPSYIIVFDRKGALKHTIGQSGGSDIPFYYIENIEVDSEDRLFVVSRSFNTWSVSRYIGKRRDFNCNLGKIDFSDAEKEGTFSGKIESVRIMKNGRGFVISVAYYLQSRFKYRKIFEYSVEHDKIVNTMVNTPDPKNELFAIVDSRYLYLWNVENKKIKFMVTNRDGGIVNNMQLKLPEKFDSFGEFLIDDTGTFYSLSAQRDSIAVIEWK